MGQAPGTGTRGPLWCESSGTSWRQGKLLRSPERLSCIDLDPNMVRFLGEGVYCPYSPILTIFPHPKQHSGWVQGISWVQPRDTRFLPEAYCPLGRQRGARWGRGGTCFPWQRRLLGSCGGSPEHLASLSGCTLDVLVHQKPCQMFPTEAGAEGSEEHKYFVTFLGFAAPGVPRDLTLA